jgi:hypothetical protein
MVNIDKATKLAIKDTLSLVEYASIMPFKIAKEQCVNNMNMNSERKKKRGRER